jgi:hypothetical protein
MATPSRNASPAAVIYYLTSIAESTESLDMNALDSIGGYAMGGLAAALTCRCVQACSLDNQQGVAVNQSIVAW